jgi:HEAT repeat protein
MKNDGNAAVRKEALAALTRYPADKNITDAFLYVLSNDKNSGLRVASINALADLKQRGELVNDEIKNVLNKKAENDNNNFVRIRAASILQEVK